MLMYDNFTRIFCSVVVFSIQNVKDFLLETESLRNIFHLKSIFLVVATTNPLHEHV